MPKLSHEIILINKLSSDGIFYCWIRKGKSLKRAHTLVKRKNDFRKNDDGKNYFLNNDYLEKSLYRTSTISVISRLSSIKGRRARIRDARDMYNNF